MLIDYNIKRKVLTYTLQYKATATKVVHISADQFIYDQ